MDLVVAVVVAAAVVSVSVSFWNGPLAPCDSALVLAASRLQTPACLCPCQEAPTAEGGPSLCSADASPTPLASTRRLRSTRCRRHTQSRQILLVVVLVLHVSAVNNSLPLGLYLDDSCLVVVV